MWARKITIFLIALLITYVGVSYVVEFKLETSFQKLKTQVITLFQQKMKERKLIVPQFEKHLNLDLLFQNHWQSDAGYFLLLKDNVVSKIGPSMELDNYERLYKTQRVAILFENKQATDIKGTMQTWVFIADEPTKTYLGWILKSALLQEKDFSIFKQINPMDVTYSKGDLNAQMILKKNGTFKTHWKAKGSGLFLKGKDNGQVYIYEDIIWAKKQNQDYLYDFFILDETNHLIQEYRFRLDTIKMTMYTLPEE